MSQSAVQPFRRFLSLQLSSPDKMCDNGSVVGNCVKKDAAAVFVNS